MRTTLTVAAEAEKRFADIFGRGGDPYIEPYLCDDAEYVAVGLGSLTYQLRVSVDSLEKRGHQGGRHGRSLLQAFPGRGDGQCTEREKRRYRL